MGYEYAWEKLHTAVMILAASPQSLQDRIKDAYTSSLMRLRPEHHFPDPDIRERFLHLKQEIESRSGHSQLAERSEADFRRIAEEIVSLYDNAARRVGDK